MAFSGDPVAAFGGIVASNRSVNLAMAEGMRSVFYEIVVAPGYEADALYLLKSKKNMRILQAELPPGYGEIEPNFFDFRRVKGGFLVQESDSLPENSVKLKTVSKRKPSEADLGDLLFAWRVVKHIKSNAIVLAKDKTLLGMGAGQPSRIVSAQLAKEKAGEKSVGSVMASDAMFPFPDVVEMAAAAGVIAIIQPGGSIRDKDSIQVADEHNIAMVFTGTRHFRH
jgi:phosphoribosylaminoimidazolecarboxamide formyltransferase/IMP cyclohydrolase